MCPTPIPYNLCEIWAAYFDFLRAYLKDKSDSEDMGQLCNTNLFGLKGTGTTTNNSNNNSSHISSNTHQFNLSKANVYRSQKCLPNFNERSHENLNGIHNRIPPPAPPPPTPLSSHRRCHPHYQNNNENKQSNNAVSLKANACMNNQLILSVSQQHVSVLHDRLVNLSQLSENSFKALQVLLESVKNAMSTFSSTIPASSLSSVLTLSKSVSTLPTSGYFYYRKSQNFLCANNNSTDDQKLFGVHMNNRNNLYYKQLMPKRIAGLRKMLGRIGVDWKSLIVPACLPVDTDYFPDTNRLRSEWYILHDYRVVPSGMSPDEWALMNNDDLEPGAYYNRRQLTAREVFQEMVLQRISQGFQLCHEVVQHNPTSSNSVEHHHSVASINSSNSTVSSSSNGSTTNKILQNENASSNISPNDNKSQNKSLLKQNCERRDQRNMTRTTPHITYNNRISNTTANSASPAVSNTNTRRSGNVLTSRNPGPQLMKSSHHCHPARISSKVNHNNNPQCFKGSCMTSTHSGRVLGLGLSTNYPSNRSGNQSTASGRGAGGGLTATASIGSRSIHTVHNSSTTNSILSPLSKFGDTDKLLKTTRKLSIGHLFHLIALDEDSIAVTSYRQIDKLIKITYSYALQVPDAKSYVSLQTNFTSDSTVILNWNYLDNYLCNRGISDSFRLLPNLKFWRSRFFVLPVYSNETKRLTEAIRDNTTGSRIPCDVYEMDYINMNREKTCEKFVHFVESINRIRRTVLPSRKLNRQSATDKPDIHRVNTCIISCGNTLSDSSMPTTPMYSVSGSHKPKIGSITNTSTHARASAVSPSTIGSWNEPSDSSNSNHTSVQNISGSSSQVNITPTDDYHSTTSLPSLLGMFYQTCEDQSTPSQTPQHLSTGSASAVNLRFLNSTVIPYYMVALMMADNENGLPFISVTTTNAFPDYTFISIDAVNWIIKWFPDIGTIEQAVIYLQKLIETGWICHTSGNRKHAFIYGTYFYTLLIQDLKQANCCAQVETSLSLSAPDCVDLNIHSAPVTPIQSSASIANYTIGSSANTSQSISGLTSSVFVSTTTTITTASMCTANNCFSSSCFSSTANTTTTMTTATISANLASANTLGGNVNLPNTLGNTNSTTHINSSGSSISNIGASVTLTASNYMNAAASSSSSCSVTTTTGNSTTGSNNISSVGYGNLPLSTTKQNEFNIKSSDVLLNYFGSLPSMDLNLQNQQQQLQQPLSFPKGYIPKLLDDTTKWTCIFQNEWAEIAIVYYGTDEHQRRQHIRHGRCMNLNDSLNTTTNTVSSSDNTLTSRSTVTVNTTSNDALSSSSDCDFKSQTQSGISAELKNFKKDGLLKHSLISGLFGIPDKTGFQEIDQILRKSCLCDMDEPDIDGRVEWAHCVYDANYHPTCAFSIELQWLVVTGGRMAELVSLWHQKACTANLHFFPVPCYPFNQSKDDLSDKDPLRKPIFVPVNISVLIDTARIFYEQSSANYNISLKSENDINPHMNVLELVNYLFPGLSHAERLTCIRCFQDSILRRFGFISDSCDKDRLNYELHGQFAFNSCCSPKQWIYVHCSGGIFALIPLYETTEPEVNDKTKVSYDTSEPLEVHNTEGLDNSNDYLQGDKKVINMNMAEKQLDYSVNCYLLQKAIGYFWAWNHMLPRRWRGHLTGDESFQDGMLADFRAFLNGEDARLSQYFVQFLKSLTLQSM
ncbi:unnamed protein product [Heterobilharzia americana]|nr:unnamed protein product [Heterobilharzia americana]